MGVYGALLESAMAKDTGGHSTLKSSMAMAIPVAPPLDVASVTCVNCPLMRDRAIHEWTSFMRLHAVVGSPAISLDGGLNGYQV